MTNSILLKLVTLIIAGTLSFIPISTFSYSINTDLEQTDIQLLIQTFDQDEAVLNRKYNVRYSHEYFERFDLFYSDWRERIEAINFDDLTFKDKVDYTLLKNHINRAHYFMNSDKEKFLLIIDWLPDLYSFMEFINDRRVGTQPDAQAIAEWMNSWNKEVDALSNKLESSPPLLRRETVVVAAALSNIQEALEDAYTFYHGYDIEFTWWTEKPYETLHKTLEEYKKLISNAYDPEAEQLDNSGIVGNPIGEDEIIKRLEFEMISYSPQELIDIAEHQFAKSEQEMLKASRELGYGDNWLEALEHVKNNYVQPGSKPELIMRLHNESVDFIKERDLLNIPELVNEVWRMRMMSPERQLINPFFTGGEVISISYPTHTMDHEAKMMSMRGNNPHFNRATVQHELIPGHHLQGFYNRRYSTYRSPFRTSFWGEGWALYWELLLWDLGFAETPEDRIGMLFWRTHRYARIIFSLNYHLGNWTPQQSIDYLVERVGHEYANAEAEVRRSFEGNYGPLYQIAYMIGGMQIYALYKDLVENGEMSAKEFHDTILKEGSIPIRAVRSILNHENLTKEGPDAWNFAEYIYD